MAINTNMRVSDGGGTTKKKTTPKTTSTNTKKTTNLADSVSQSINKTQTTTKKTSASQTNKSNTSKNTSSNKTSENKAKTSSYNTREKVKANKTTNSKSYTTPKTSNAIDSTQVKNTKVQETKTNNKPYTSNAKDSVDRQTQTKNTQTQIKNTQKQTKPNNLVTQVDIDTTNGSRENAPSSIKQTKEKKSIFSGSIFDSSTQSTNSDDLKDSGNKLPVKTQDGSYKLDTTKKETKNTKSRADFNSDDEYEMYYVSEHTDKNASKGGLAELIGKVKDAFININDDKNFKSYLEQKAKEKGVSTQTYLDEMFSKNRNKLVTEQVVNDYKNGLRDDEDLDGANKMFGVMVDSSGNQVDYEQYQKDVETYQNNVDKINSKVEKLNEQAQNGKLTEEEYNLKYNQYVQEWEENSALGKQLESIQTLTGVDYYDWAKEHNVDTSDFEAYVEASDDTWLERTTESFVANNVNHVASRIDWIQAMTNKLGITNFDIISKDNIGTKLSDYSDELQTYANANREISSLTDLASAKGLKSLPTAVTNSLMGFAVETLWGSVTGLDPSVNMGITSGGQQMRDMLENGYSLDISIASGVGYGLVNWFTEHKLGADKLANKLTGGATELLIGSTVADVLKFAGQSGLSEGMEEIAEDWGDVLVNLGTNLWAKSMGWEDQMVDLGIPNIEDMSLEFLLAFVGGFGMAGAKGTQVALSTKQEYNATFNASETLKQAINSGNYDEETNNNFKSILDNMAKAMTDFKNNSKLAFAVDLESDKVSPLPDYDTIRQNMYNSALPNMDATLQQNEQVLQSAQYGLNAIQRALYRQGLDIKASDWATLDNDTRTRYKTMTDNARAMGVEVEGRTDLPSNINSYISSNGKLVINLNSDVDFESLLGHEITHKLEGTKLYDKLANLVKNTENFEELYNQTARTYENVEDANIDNESIAKYIEKNISNQDFIESVIKYDSSLANRIYTSIQSMVENDSKTQIENAWKKAFRKADVSNQTRVDYQNLKKEEKVEDVNMESSDDVAIAYSLKDNELIDYGNGISSKAIVKEQATLINALKSFLDVDNRRNNNEYTSLISDMTQQILNDGQISEETYNNLRNLAWENAKTRNSELYGEQYNPSEIRNYLKRNPFNLDEVLSNYSRSGEDIQQFINSHYGSMRFSYDAKNDWDSTMSELQNNYPSLIDYDSITNAYDLVLALDDALETLDDMKNGYSVDYLSKGFESEEEYRDWFDTKFNSTIEMYAQGIYEDFGKANKEVQELAEDATSQDDISNMTDEEIQERYGDVLGQDVGEEYIHTFTPPNFDNVVRDTEIPVYNEKGKTSKSAKTMADSGYFDDEASKRIVERAKNGKMNTRGHNNARIEALARDKIAELKTFDNVVAWVLKGDNVKIKDADMTTQMAIFTVQAINEEVNTLNKEIASLNKETDIEEIAKKQNKINEYNDLIEKISNANYRLASTSGDALRSQALWKQSTPQGQIQMIRESIADMQEGLNKRRGDKAPNLVLNEDLANQFLNAETDAQKQEIIKQITQDIAKQIPPTFTEQLNAWRHMSMLFNTRTWIKNALANAVMGQVATMKQALASSLETMYFRKNNITEEQIKEYANRDEVIEKATKENIDPYQFAKMELGKHSGAYDMFADKTLLKGLMEDYDKNYKDFKSKYAGGDLGRYLGSSEFEQDVNSMRDQFSISQLNWLAEQQAKFMSDAPAMRKAYGKTIIGWLKANNLQWETLTDEQRAYARYYAFNQARVITFNETNKWANAITKFANENGKFAKILADSFIPFRRTPLNILKQGVRYSPIGLIQSVLQYQTKLKNGEMSATQVIDNMASGLTGTAIVALGGALYSLGMFRTTDDDKDKKKYFDEDNGEQDYALVTPIGTYTIDWLDPLIMPLSMGAELAKFFEDGDISDFTLDNIINLITAMEAPIFETSMLSGIRSAFQSYDDDDASWFNTLMTTIGSNYLSQYIPTMLGAIARTIDPYRRTTYPNDGAIDKTLKTIANRTPFLSMTSQPYINKQGEEERTEDMGLGIVGRAFFNFLSPGYYSSKSVDKYDEELYRLYGETGDVSVFPSDSTKSINYDNNTYELKGKDYTQWNKTRLSLETQYVNEFIDSKNYSSYDDSTKAGIIEQIRKYAGQVAKEELLAKNGVTYDETSYLNAKEALNNDLDLYQYFEAKNYYNQDGVDKTAYVDYLSNLDATGTAKNYLYDKQYGSSEFSTQVNNMAISDDSKFAIKVANSKYTKNKVDENGKSITNSKALAIANEYAKAGVLEEVWNYIAENGLQPSTFGLNKTVYAMSYGEMQAKYQAIWGEEFGNGESVDLNGSYTSSGGSSKSSSRKSSSKSSSGGSSSSDIEVYGSVDTPDREDYDYDTPTTSSSGSSYQNAYDSIMGGTTSQTKRDYGQSTSESNSESSVYCNNCGNVVKPVNGRCPVCGASL